MLYSFGSNGRGQLSLSHTNDVNTPTLCHLPSPFPQIPPQTIVSGGNHTLILFPTGEAFSVGDNTSSKCFINTFSKCFTNTSSTTFQPIHAPTHGGAWRLASAGWDFTVLVSTTDHIFVSGSGARGELGLGEAVHTAVSQRIPNFPPEGTSVVGISSCVAHTLVVLDNGGVYGWGAGRKGQLGSPALPVVSSPRRINAPWAVEKAVCGRDFSILLSRGRMLLLGNDKYGIGAALESHTEGVVDLQASWSGVYIRYSDGRLVGFGRNDRGQLPPPGLPPVQGFAAGSEHGVAIVEGKLVAWGWGEHGNCGRVGDVVGEAEEVKVPSEGEVVAVGAGCATSWVWLDEGDG